MSSAMRKVNAITQIVRLRQVVRRWNSNSLMRRAGYTHFSDSDKPPARRTPPGSVAVYVGPERSRFVVPTRFLNLPVLVSLLNQAEEEFGYQAAGAITLPCEAGFFACIIHLLEKDEKSFHGLELNEFVEMVSATRFQSCDQSCKGSYLSPPAFCAVTPLLHKARV
ncbi:protein SMALL AUXIN UP-REGULATED RNA 51-like [Salvia miltiorrhiza]|uniref:protein SMALL AUXIN UP-REGULATED RNA 51-like n=1 Tax=Salvia miltiorrhiza TaxID=226208 RepID=UPI0025AD4967|nr:protein SMALL AUXIN UP-REGULATED RNA 51-like [Salvia miltiorrhiza]